MTEDCSHETRVGCSDGCEVCAACGVTIPPVEKARTVRVRLLVAVWPDGEWCVVIDRTTIRRSGSRFVAVEADLPIPSEPAAVAGRVVGEG